MINNKDLKKQILDLSYKYKLAHIGSCITAVDIIDEIFSIKKSGEKFVLSSGHAGLALYCVLEKYYQGDSTGLIEGLDAEKIWLHHGVHSDRCKECGIDCSAGSLGHGLGIAVGMALADRSKNVYCLISDGECSEGSIWEALRIANEQKLSNLRIYVNCNGWAAYKSIDVSEHSELKKQLGYFNPMRTHTNSDQLCQSRMMPEFHKDSPYMFIVNTNVDDFPFLNIPDGQQAHYHVMSEDEYNEGIKVLK